MPWLVNLDHPDGSSSDHEYLCIHNDFFDRILETDQDSDIKLNVIHIETSLSSINAKISNSRSEKYSMSEMVTTRHQIQRKRCKKSKIIHRNRSMNSN